MYVWLFKYEISKLLSGVVTKYLVNDYDVGMCVLYNFCELLNVFKKITFDFTFNE